MPGSVRIISGRWRRQRVVVHAIEGLRPTGDRVRETLFNWLTPRIEGAACADLFAGSGILGLEAASRGAASVAMLEANPAAARALTKEYQRLQSLAPLATEVQIECADAVGWLQAFVHACRPPLDVVFLDPPFHSSALAQCLDLLTSTSVLNPGARIYVETAADVELELPEGLEPVRSGRAAQVRYHLAAFEH